MIKTGHNLARELDTKCHIHIVLEMFEVNEAIKNFGIRPV